ncbi:transmembrane protein 222 [Marchantia polymorpha subsp. ruderalis]|nr:hypothetical protein AXG93_3964s1020 [Marchantia polymorpha subsp. ruderalis]PTQ27266.1 hypothetical protein MARPO_0209s0001 [Marchantia polymorpha]PTQ27268.1 hypothetical protein MARPO_0209s0001 [Marchantia polymorpha]BBN00529.1 hypothetical protein Mp_1g29830 [Marchantia polymorpha subsp. ruderalis]BBN00530.1 hypothetical protein Mp_1g29830 [Marchantia polymorpha subsp. ruderalis]|eukprot:PTQ27266.1 hypothetical protein MARPO_0209s0001 [Marchantia polymorpha]
MALSIPDTEGLSEDSELKEFKVSPAMPPVDASKSRFPYCVVWTPLPVVAWLAPFVGHVGICREDGVILDFAGPFFVNVDNFAFGSTARYVRLDIDKCCFPPHLSGHTCENGFAHSELGTGISWDDALRMGMHNYQHKSYNLFTCNCHSFTASCMNRLAYKGSIRWNIIDIAVLVLLKGRWVNSAAILRSFGPFFVVMAVGLLIAGWPFLIGWAAFSGLLVAWFLIATYCMSDVIHC